jgi:O-antigen ligase
MKQILLHPLIFTLIIGTALVYLPLAFQLINTNTNLVEKFEKCCIFLLLLTIAGGGGFSILSKFHPEALYLTSKTLPSMIMQLGVYLICCLFLASRLRNTLKDSINIILLLVKNHPFFCLYNLTALLSSILSQTPVLALRTNIVILVTAFVFIYVGKQYNMKELFIMVVWYHTVLLLMSVLHGNQGDSWTGVLGHKNQFGPTMALTAVLLYLQSVRVPRYRWLFLGLAALAIFCVQKASSGMGKVVLILLISLLGFLRFIKRLPPRLAFACMGVFLAIGMALVILITENAEYIVVEKLGKDMTLTGRTHIWPLVVAAINRRPWLGYGYQGFWQPWRGEANQGLEIVTPSGFIAMHSHNGFLDMALELGWVGLSLFILSLLMNIYYGVRHLTRSKGPESVLPLLIFTWIVITNITEVGINQISRSWVFYVLMTARLTMNQALEDFRSHSKFQE